MDSFIKYKWIGEFYSNSLEFHTKLNEREVRQYLREYHDVDRLWNGTELWIDDGLGI